MHGSLDGRVAVVTGGGRGIGREIALALALAGARVVVAGRSTELLEGTAKEISGRGGEALAWRADITHEEEVDALRDACAERFGPADTLVCNSGAGGPSAPLWEIERADWESTMAVNVTGTFLCCRSFLPAMLEERSGSVVVIGSMTGKRHLVNRTPYAASKLALVGLVRTLAHEVGSYGVRVNLVSPGAVTGERIEWAIRGQAEAQGISTEAARDQFAAASALRRLVEPTEVASAVVFLASETAAGITGEDLNVSAGMAMF